jgi:hypothetical protein
MITEMLLWLQEMEQLVCLVPELCYLTGLTDTMRNDFHVMKDIAMYTRITPNQRQAALKKFMRNIQGMRKVMSIGHSFISSVRKTPLVNCIISVFTQFITSKFNKQIGHAFTDVPINSTFWPPIT